MNTQRLSAVAEPELARVRAHNRRNWSEALLGGGKYQLPPNESARERAAKGSVCNASLL